MKTIAVLSSGSNSYAFAVEIDGKKVFTWDQGFMPLPAHSCVDTFVDEIMSAASDLLEMPERDFEKVQGVFLRDALKNALVAWPNETSAKLGAITVKSCRSDGFSRASLRFFCALP